MHLVPRGPRRAGFAFLVFGLVLALGPSRPTAACDICAIYTATEMQQSRTGLRLGVAQQVSQFTSLQLDGRSVANPASEEMTSAITQFVAGYQLTPALGLQLNAPWIHRDFRRVNGSAIETGHETGFGDLSLLASYRAWSRVRASGVMQVSVLGGVKLPTGSTGRLREDLPPAFDPDRVRDRLNENFGLGRSRDATVAVRQAHIGIDGAPLSGIHGHDLSLGTGSTDPVLGAQFLWTWQRAVFTAHGQYVFRTKGSHGYRYADEFTAGFHPGVFVTLDHRHSLTLQLATTIETKGKDTQFGRRVIDTALTAVYLGPALHFTWGSALSLDFAVDLPAYLDNSYLQIVPDFRLRTGLVWRL